MQTFLPYPDFNKSVKCLDNRRLGKQRVEAYQIIRTLKGISNGWQNHPIVKMWKGYVPALENYMFLCIKEWKNRGFINNLKSIYNGENIEYPKWFGYENFHLSHRMNLLRKNFQYYKQFFIDEIKKYNIEEINNWKYIWIK